jgi:hypothetical protein
MANIPAKRLVVHVGIAFQFRIHRDQIIRAVDLDAVTA